MTPARDREALDQAIVRGSELLKQGKLDQAQRAFRAALDIDADNPKVLALLGLTHFRAGEFAEARPIYEDLVELAPTDASHRLNLGLVYLKLNDSDHAITALEASRALDPSQGRAVSYLGLAYARAGRYAEAYRSFLLAGQNELAIEIESNLTPAERDGIHNQLARTPAGPLPGVSRTMTPARTAPAAVSRAPTPTTPAQPPTPTPPTPTPEEPASARTRSQPRTAPPIAPPGSKARAQSQDDLQRSSTVELAAKREMPKDAEDHEIAGADERVSDRDIVAAAASPAPPADPVQSLFAEPPPEPAEVSPMTVSQQFVLPKDDAMPRPIDGQSMLSHAVAVAAPLATTAARTVTGGFAARPLSELATEELVRPDDATDAFEIGANGALLVRVTERVLTRLDGVHITGGDLTYEIAHRRSRGHQTEEQFDDGGTALHAVSGKGYLIAMPGKRAFTAVMLDDDILYLREDLVFAFEGTLRWENGNVPGLRGKLHVVQFRGDGALVLRLHRPLVRVKLPPQGLVFVDAERLAGWIGRVIPRAVVPPSGGPLGTMCVECTGEGIVLVEPAPDTETPTIAASEPEPAPAPESEAAPAPPPELADFAAALAQPDPADEI